MRKFLKLIGIVVFMFGSFVLYGCDKTPEQTPDKKPGDSTDTPDGDDDVEEPAYDFLGEDFIIMVDQVNIDPRDSNYKQMFKDEKVAKIREVEDKYNVNIVFEQYPSEASWGGARQRYITQASASGTVKAHVYQVASSWIGSLAKDKAISPLDEYIEKYGQGMWESALEHGKALGKTYGYYDNYPIADEGIFYNMDLLEQYLGEGKGELPSQLWLNGEWTWDKFKEICNTLNEAMPGDKYVMGGAIYNWAYQMLGANGVHVVDTDFKSGLATQAGIDTITYMNGLFNGLRWDWDVNPSNATSTSMVTGNVAFHNGQSYWIFQGGKWLGKEFQIGFVPYPVGPNVEDDLSNYYINDVYGKTQYVISSFYSKDKVEEGYEDSTLHDEIIFKIWSELQYLPEIDDATGEASIDAFLDEYVSNRCEIYYGGEASVEAHRSIMNKDYPDRFFTLSNATAQTDEGFGFMIRNIIKGDINEARASLSSMVTQIHQGFKDLYSLADDYYA